MAGRLDGKVAIVTGSTSGIGRASAVLFAQEGARVVVNGRRQELGEQVVEEITRAGGTATFFHGDLAEDGAVQALVKYGVATYGRLDIMMNNANTRDSSYTGAGGRTVVDMEEQAWEASTSTGLRTTFLGCKYAIPPMLENGGGSIINVSSVHGLLVARNSPSYETVKAGMINLTRQVALDFGRQGIRANAICPGLIVIERWTERFANLENMRREEAIYPMGRPGWPVEVAGCALFLASEESSFVTGHALVVDGGLTIQLQDSLVYKVEETLREQGGHF